MTKTVNVPRELAEYAAEVLIESGCLPDEYTPECAQCRMRLMGERLKAVLDQPAAEPSEEPIPPGFRALSDVIAESEKDPERKVRLDKARAALNRTGDQ